MVSCVQYGVFIQVLQACSDVVMKLLFCYSRNPAFVYTKESRVSDKEKCHSFYTPLLRLSWHSIFHHGPDK